MQLDMWKTEWTHWTPSKCDGKIMYKNCGVQRHLQWRGECLIQIACQNCLWRLLFTFTLHPTFSCYIGLFPNEPLSQCVIILFIYHGSLSNRITTSWGQEIVFWSLVNSHCSAPCLYKVGTQMHLLNEWINETTGQLYIDVYSFFASWVFFASCIKVNLFELMYSIDFWFKYSRQGMMKACPRVGIVGLQKRGRYRVN